MSEILGFEFMKKISIVCRCEDITEEDVIKAIEEGYTDIEELRKKLRIGMGPCQGRVCIQLVAKILEKKPVKRSQVFLYQPLGHLKFLFH
jgi:NAD(P)H-nitrite reductase large subunit